MRRKEKQLHYNMLKNSVNTKKVLCSAQESQDLEAWMAEEKAGDGIWDKEYQQWTHRPEGWALRLRRI